MKGIDFSNKKIEGLTPLNIYKDEKIKHFGIGGTLTEVLLPLYQKLLKEAIGNKADEKFKDFALNNVQTEQIKTIFSQKIDETLPKIEKDDFLLPNQRLHWKGKDYDLNLSLISPNNRRIWDFYKIITIAEECLAENKPMYLSIE